MTDSAGPAALVVRCAATILLPDVVLFAPDMSRSNVLTTRLHGGRGAAVNLPTGFRRLDSRGAPLCRSIGDCAERQCRSLAHHLQGPSQPANTKLSPFCLEPLNAAA